MTLLERRLAKSLIAKADIQDCITLSGLYINEALSFIKKCIKYIETNWKASFSSKELKYAFALPTIDLYGTTVYRGMFVLPKDAHKFEDEYIDYKLYQQGQFSSWTRNKKVADYFTSEAHSYIPIKLEQKDSLLY